MERRTIEQWVRPNILRMKPYSSARDEYSGHEASVFLDANENPYNDPNNRYPDPMQRELKKALSRIKNVPSENIFLGNGSDEAIDLVYRAFCEPRIDNVVAIDPTYGMYQVCAEVNDVEYRKVLLDEHFQFTARSILDVADEHTKVVFLCSPNNPTGNCLSHIEIETLLSSFDGLVIVDEAYIDFASTPGFLGELDKHSNLIILQTFSKAWGCAAIRLGMAFASSDIIDIFNKIKYPYNVNLLTQRQAMEMTFRLYEKELWVETLKNERNWLHSALLKISCVVTVFPTDANFFLVKVVDAPAIYHYLVSKGIIVRSRHTVTLCGNCLRITVGTRLENEQLVAALTEWASTTTR